MHKALLVFLGAGAGGVLRYWLGGFVQARAGTALPIGTFAVNVSGCLFMGLLLARWDGPPPHREDLRLAVLTGLLGGYTTFSAFARETLDLAQQDRHLAAGAYALASVALSLAAVGTGRWLGLWLWRGLA